MGARGVSALVALLLATALLRGAASYRLLREGQASSGTGAPAPAVAPGGSTKDGSPKKSEESSAAGQQAGSKPQQEAGPPTEAAKSSKPSVQENDERKKNPLPQPEGSGTNGGGQAKGSTEHEGTGNKGNGDASEKLKEVMEKCDESHKCSVGEKFFACLHFSDNVAIGSFVVVLNKEQNEITINVKEASHIDMDRKPLRLGKGAYGQMVVKIISPNAANITLSYGDGDCIIDVSEPVSAWQQQYQQFAAYATHLNPIYGAYLFGLTVLLVGIVCICCKFARRRGNGGVPYQQLEMSAPAPNSSGVDNTTSAVDGWDDGWGDDWDDEEAPARSSDRKPASSVSANGLSLRSRTDAKDGWDVDWDD